MKAVKPLLRLGKRLAPIAALIPGYGPVIAAALRAGPKVLQIAKKLGIPLDASGKPRPKTAAQAKALHAAAQKQIAAQRRATGRIREPRRIAHPGTIKHHAILRGYDLGSYYGN
jgi:hypothetical protein